MDHHAVESQNRAFRVVNTDRELRPVALGRALPGTVVGDSMRPKDCRPPVP